MERSHKDILIHLRKKIIDDLDIDNDIIQPLRNEYILTEDHIKNIYIGATKEERAGKLLDILPLCGSSAFGVFHQSLKHHYDWLSNEIDISLGNYEIETNGEIDYYAGPLYIPPLSPLTVTREEKVDQLKIALQKLIPTEYIALHGMKGFGKSCLVASTLKDVKLVKNLFSNQVYWIKFADDRLLDEEILIQLNTLYYDVRNLEIQPESFTPLERNSLIQYLKHYFNKQENCNALLILDDVYNEKIINTFDFKCKTLVLTDNIDVVYKKRPKIIEMNDGFTEAETLGLFAKALEMDVKKLPIEAKKIHEECKGMPLLIAMFAAQFEEYKCDMRIHSDRWKYYLKSLKEKNATNKVIKEFWEKQEIIFDMCIEQLKPDLKKHYESLAIFCEDVNITPKTLEIFWKKDVFEIGDLMLDLCHKSLAAKMWNNDLKTYIYGVHDLLLTHLRKKRTDDELIQMHKSIIKEYRKYCNNDFSKLPDDNYIYSYIGYHLEQAQLFEEFHLYLNLDFIQAKLIHAGLNDLLLDLKKYKKYITLNYTDEYVEKVSDLERFLQEQASIIVHHKHKKCLDIIQIAMNHSCEGYITETAKDLVMRRQKYLYLSHKKSNQHPNISLTEEIPMDICTSSFIREGPELILTGNISGKIILWNFQSKQQKVFNGHGEKCSIKKVIVSADGDCFLSLSSVGIIKLFSLSEEINEIFDQHMHVESPRQKQSFWSDPYANLKGQDDSLAEFMVENEIILDMVFGHEEKYIVACTNRGTIQIWDLYGKIVFTLTDPKYQYITKIAFTTNASLLHLMDESKGAFLVYTNCGNDYTTYQYLTCYNLQLKSASEEVILFHHVPKYDDSLIVVTKKKAIYVKWWRTAGCVNNFNKKTTGYIDDTVTYVCATITYDGEYIILADSAGFINVWNTDSGFQPVAIYKSRVISLDSYLSDEGYHVICGNGNGALYRWKLPVQKSDDLPRKCLFDVIVSCDDMDIVVKESPLKKIIVSYGGNIIRESELITGEISNLQLSIDGNKAMYVIDNKIIQLLDIITGTTKEILAVDKPIQFVKIINILNRDLILCKWEDNILKIWQHPLVSGIETKAEESIQDIHIINDKFIITVMQNSVTVWHISVPCELISQIDLSTPNPPSNITFSCLSYDQKYLAVLNESHCLIVLYINCKNIAASLPHIQINVQRCFTHSFVQKAICCDISKNEYIAVGLESGQISIINIQKRMEIAQLSFHASPIRLYWAPVTIDVPILLSLTSDELIWWNITIAQEQYNKNNMRNRMGVTRSASAPSFSSNAFWNQRVSNSQSDIGVSKLQGEKSSTTSSDTVNDISRYWKNKIGKNPEIPGLLAVVELPPSRDPKKECRLCGEEEEGSIHILCRCPALTLKRYRSWGRMYGAQGPE